MSVKICLPFSSGRWYQRVLYHLDMNSKNTKKNTVCHVRPLLPVCLFLVISILCVYWQARNFSFVNFDDRQYVTQNYQVQAGLTAESIRWSFTATHASNWHPV